MIHKIERRDGRIWVNASDSVMVTKVHVTISDQTGKVLEAGGAVQAKPSTNSGWWQYVSNVEGKIVAEAWDLAGNVGKLVL